jgi:hypothetical protein
MVIYFNVHFCVYLSNLCIIRVAILSREHEKPNDIHGATTVLSIGDMIFWF